MNMINNKNEGVSTNSPSVWLVYFFAAVLVHWLVNFVFLDNILSPLHQDDYFMLGSGFGDFKFPVERPVSTNLVFFMGGMGQSFSFFLVNFLTVSIPVLVLYFVSSVFNARIGLVGVLVFSAMTFFHISSFEHSKFLGLITNLASHFFGCLALVFLLHARQKLSWILVLASAFFYALSVFSKEDFVFPPLLFVAYFFFKLYFPAFGRRSENAVDTDRARSWVVVVALSFTSIALLSILYSVLFRNPFVAGALGAVSSHSPYAFVGGLKVLLASLVKLTFEYALVPTGACIAALVSVGVFCQARRLESVVILLLVFSLVLPYALIPNRILPYRAFGWLPWFSAIFVVFLNLLLSGEFRRWLSDEVARFLAVFLFFICALLTYVNRSSVLGVADWYALNQGVNLRMLDTIQNYKDVFDDEILVGVVGASGLSPWSNNNGAYLKDKLKFSNRWVVFVDGSSAYYRIADFQEDSYINIVSIDEICNLQQRLFIEFDANGKGFLRYTSDLCRSQGGVISSVNFPSHGL